jgi:phosphatidylglycerol:prolipoprotein diacylglycerol transferase
MKYFYWTCSIIFVLCLVFFVFVPAFGGRLYIPSQIEIGQFAIRLYGITMALAILTGYLIARKFSWRFGISPDNVDEIVFWVTIVSLIGARIYYVIFEWEFFSANLSEIYKIWHGGISIYGALIAGALFILIYSQAFGGPTQLPWKMYVTLSNRPLEYKDAEYFHPAFLYEALLNLVIFFVLVKIFLNKGKPGVVAFWYIGLYSLGRFFIEAIRLDSSIISGVKVNQLAAVLGVMFAGFMLIYRYRKEVLVKN